MPLPIRENVPLDQHTSLGVGGPAQYWLDAEDVAAVQQGLTWGSERDLPVHVLGGGSNVLIADRGLRGLVIRPRMAAIVETDRGAEVQLDVGAGCAWDPFVAFAVERNYAGVECLSGIPGDCGAAPMQNVGAYGQEVSQTIVSVEAVERTSGERVELTPAQCEFGYRDSAFKRHARGRYLIVGVRFLLSRDGAPTIAYPELERAVREQGAPSLQAVRDTVIALRRRKSMVLDPSDENGRSAGSFFVNLTVREDAAEAIERRVFDRLGADVTMPRFPAADGLVKIPSGWLIERAGVAKGSGEGKVGVSTKHCLAVVNRGGATAAEVVAFAASVRRRVFEAFGATLTAEPRTLGFEPHELAALHAELDGAP